MTQLKYDIAEFIINNRDEIKEYLNVQTEHLAKSEVLFKDFPEMYDEILNTFRRGRLLELLSEHFPCAFESICLLLDDDFVNITLYSENP